MSTRRPVPSGKEVWAAYDEMEARLTTPLSTRMLELARLRPGMKVLDLATGRGEPAIAAARRVSPGGQVVGVDICEDMLQMARKRAVTERVTNLDLRVMDATMPTGLLENSFDAVLCRWGLMYMVNPLDALRFVFRSLRPQGRFVAAVWAEPQRVPYFSFPRHLLKKYRTVPEVDMNVPGTFRYADPDRLAYDLQSAGLSLVEFEEMDIPVMEARTNVELIEWVRAFGLTRLLNDLPEQQQQEWEGDLALESKRFYRGDRFLLGGITRIVVAVRPE